jgi:uncharacterized protein YegL
MQKIILFLSLILIYHAGSQSLHVFDVDTTDFPIMRAKFYAFDAEGKQISDLQPSDFEVTENDEPREVLNISCPTPQPPTAISSVLTIDVSGSMSGNSIEMAKEAAKSWVNALPLGKSECAITSFTLTNQYIQDFTTNRSRLLEKINGLYADGGTDFDAAFVNPIAGGLLVLEKAKHKKVMVLITDGYASGNESNIISKAQALDAEVYCVTLGFECPEILKNISEQTGGKWFENVTTIDQALEVYSKILLYSQRNEPCAIEWQSKLSCISNIINCKYSVPYLSQESTLNYFLSQNKVKRLAFEPSAILYFNKPLGERADTIITVTAQNADFNIANITCNSAEFDINPKSFSLKQGESKQLTITLTPSNKDYKFEVFSIETDVCDTKYSCYSKHIGQPGTSNPTLKLTHPIGGEEFLVGTDTIITWEGVAQSDTISIEYSSDNGNNWKFINTTASGHSHKWNDIPKPTSNTCKVRIRSNEVNVYKTDRDIIDLSGHVGPLYSIDWSPNGNQVATAGLDISGRIWDARTGAMLHNLSKQTPFLYNISWSPDLSTLLTELSNLK